MSSEKYYHELWIVMLEANEGKFKVCFILLTHRMKKEMIRWGGSTRRFKLTYLSSQGFQPSIFVKLYKIFLNHRRVPIQSPFYRSRRVTLNRAWLTYKRNLNNQQLSFVNWIVIKASVWCPYAWKQNRFFFSFTRRPAGSKQSRAAKLSRALQKIYIPLEIKKEGEVLEFTY